ncbi:MAG TPA: hypothetical protein VG247_18900 [Pseudonocardiaceae bacterium]|jgi:hypothetical protein|nr:hypothetical protein [Pseudonocardiaceae bacterium]
MMDDERISHGLAVLAEDMPTPDIGDIVAASRTHIRRRRAVTATWLGTAAVVGVLAGVITVVGDHAPVSAAQGGPTTSPGPKVVPNNQPIIDDRARALDQQLNKVKNDVIPAGMTISPDPRDRITVDGRVLGFEFSTTEHDFSTDGQPLIKDSQGKPIGPPLYTGRSYLLDVKLSDTQGWGTVSIQVMHKNSAATAAHLPVCQAAPSACQTTDFPDGTRAIVSTAESGRGYPNSGTDVRVGALRPDGTYIDILCTNLPFTAGPITSDSPTQPTRPQTPLSAAELLKLATALTY